MKRTSHEREISHCYFGTGESPAGRVDIENDNVNTINKFNFSELTNDTEVSSYNEAFEMVEL